MNYKIKYANPTAQYLQIEAEMSCSGKHEVILQFPAWRPGRYELGNFAKNVKNFYVLNDKNIKCEARKISKDAWVVKTAGLAKITACYSYYANEINAGSSFMNDEQLYVNPINCLVYVQELQNEACTLSLEIPPHFQLATAAHHENNVITCVDYHELVDSPFIASASLQHKTYTVLSRTFHLWFQGKVELDWDKIIRDFSRFTLKQIEQFSNRRKKIVGFPKSDYHFLFQILPFKAYHGVEHLSSTVIALGPSYALMNELYDDFLGVSSHELYHKWNIKSIRPAEMYPYNYASENYSELGYIAEGVTTYLGDIFLASSGVKTFKWYKLEMEKLLQKHFDNFGRFNYSVAESSWDTWLDGYSKGAPARKVSIYNEGALLAFVMDMAIRRGSSNKASIHSVMNKLYVEHAQQNKGYTETDYKNECELFSTLDLSGFFENYVHGNMPYESILVEALESIGLEISMENNPKHAERILGIKTVDIDLKSVVSDIFPGSSAEMAGVMIGDELISINDIRIRGDVNEVMALFQDRAIFLQIDRMGRLLRFECPNINKSQYPIYKIQKMAIPSVKGRNTFKYWIGSKWEDA